MSKSVILCGCLQGPVSSQASVLAWATKQLGFVLAHPKTADEEKLLQWFADSYWMIECTVSDGFQQVPGDYEQYTAPCAIRCQTNSK